MKKLIIAMAVMAFGALAFGDETPATGAGTGTTATTGDAAKTDTKTTETTKTTEKKTAHKGHHTKKAKDKDATGADKGAM